MQDTLLFETCLLATSMTPIVACIFTRHYLNCYSTRNTPPRIQHNIQHNIDHQRPTCQATPGGAPPRPPVPPSTQTTENSDDGNSNPKDWLSLLQTPLPLTINMPWDGVIKYITSGVHTAHRCVPYQHRPLLQTHPQTSTCHCRAVAGRWCSLYVDPDRPHRAADAALGAGTAIPTHHCAIHGRDSGWTRGCIACRPAT